MIDILERRQREAVRWFHSLSVNRARASHPGPRVVANSIPKAGTHLLTRCLHLFPDIEDSGLRIRGRVRYKALKKRLNQVGGGCFIPLHLFFTPRREQLLTDLAFAMVLITRDPRDIATSHFHYVAHGARLHQLRGYYQALPDDSARLMTSIQGIPQSEWRDRVRLSDINRRCRAFLDWADRGACVVQFEKLVGPLGGGTQEEQRGEISKVARHLNLELDPATLNHIASNVYSRKTSTFRKGTIGDWANHMAPEHKTAFNEVAGQLLIDLGYEADDNW